MFEIAPSSENGFTSTELNYFLTDGWCYTRTPGLNGNYVTVGGIGLHWMLFYDTSNSSNPYKLWYKFYVWHGIHGSTPIWFGPMFGNSGKIEIFLNNNATAIKTFDNIAAINYEKARSDVDNDPSFRWHGLILSDNTSFFYGFTNNFSLSSTNTITVAIKISTNTGANNYVTLINHKYNRNTQQNDYYYNFAFEIENGTYSTTENFTPYDTTLLNFPTSLASGVQIKATDINDFKTYIYNEIMLRRQIKAPKPMGGVNNSLSSSQGQLIDNINIINNIVNNGIKTVNSIPSSYTTTSGTLINNLESARTELNTLLSKPIRSNVSGSDGGCTGNACMGLCSEACSSLCVTTCSNCASDCVGACSGCQGACSDNVNQTGGSSCNGACSTTCTGNCTGSSKAMGGCFAPGTKILMADGSEKNIEDIKNNDLVIAYDEVKQCPVIKEVIKSYAHLNTPRLIKITLANNTEVYLTPGHPILTTKGWKSLDIQNSILEHGVNVTLLKINDEILNLSLKPIKIKAIEEVIIGTNYTSYNIEVKDCHTFFANNIVVHNSKSGVIVSIVQ